MCTNTSNTTNTYQRTFFLHTFNTRTRHDCTRATAPHEQNVTFYAKKGPYALFCQKLVVYNTR